MFVQLFWEELKKSPVFQIILTLSILKHFVFTIYHPLI